MKYPVHRYTNQIQMTNLRRGPEYVDRQDVGQIATEDFSELAEKSLQAILIFQDQRVAYANPASMVLYGYSADELKAMPAEQLLAIVHPLDRGVSDERARKRQAGEEVNPGVELRILRKDGSTCWIQSFNNPIEFRRRPAILTTSIDITERKHAEEALCAAQHTMQRLLASSPAVLFSIKIENGEFRGHGWMSENIEAMLGYRVDETLAGDWWLSNLHPADSDAVRKRFRSEIMSREYTADEYRFRHKDGEYRWIRSETRLLRDAAGQPAEIVGSLSNISERKRLEEQLRQAQKMEAIGVLAAGIAHDFNNLLTIISGYCDILRPSLSPADPVLEGIATIRSAAQRGAGIIRQLLAFSRQSVLQPQVVDLNKVVRENENMLRRLIGEDVDLSVVLQPALDSVRVDPGQISQVIMNLAVNARGAMPTGGKLTIETKTIVLDEQSSVFVPEATAGRYVRLAVTDTGIGMTPEVRAHIFEPFFTTKPQGEGSGLGLATVYGIVKQSAGYIAVCSEPGAGASFTIYFPTTEDPTPARDPSTDSRHLARGTETILLVEDEDDLRSMLRLALQQAGYSVLEASRGTEALRLFTEHLQPIHLMITDVVMPGMSGRELVERLSRLRPEIKVMYLSGYTGDAVLRHGVLEAEVAFVHKPVTLPALMNKVRQVLDAPPDLRGGDF
jgi:two-component system cell cycle sensor histidine kinase/response regulator CckA